MALFTSLLALFFLTSAAAGLGVRLCAREAAVGRLSSAASAATLVGPVLLGVGVCSSLLWPGFVQSACHCLAHGLHHPHLCLRHPDFAGAVLLPAAFVTCGWACFALPRFTRLLLDLWRTERWSTLLATAPVNVCDGVRFRLIDAPALGACTTGLFRPLIAIDQGLWRTLGEDERRAVLHHEDAHCQRLDPLTLVILRACAALCLVPVSDRLLGLWHGSAEKECDRYAAARLGMPDAVAAALLKLERHRQLGHVPALSTGVAAPGSDLAQRVRTLLEPGFSHARVNLANDVLASTLVGFSLTALLTLIGGEALHHATETLLGLFVGGH
jgi:Zn-dependent protease with chaperone function